MLDAPVAEDLAPAAVKVPDYHIISLRYGTEIWVNFGEHLDPCWLSAERSEAIQHAIAALFADRAPSFAVRGLLDEHCFSTLCLEFGRQLTKNQQKTVGMLLCIIRQSILAGTLLHGPAPIASQLTPVDTPQAQVMNFSSGGALVKITLPPDLPSDWPTAVERRSYAQLLGQALGRAGRIECWALTGGGSRRLDFRLGFRLTETEQATASQFVTGLVARQSRSS